MLVVNLHHFTRSLRPFAPLLQPAGSRLDRLPFREHRVQALNGEEMASIATNSSSNEAGSSLRASLSPLSDDVKRTGADAGCMLDPAARSASDLDVEHKKEMSEAEKLREVGLH